MKSSYQAGHGSQQILRSDQSHPIHTPLICNLNRELSVQVISQLIGQRSLNVRWQTGLLYAMISYMLYYQIIRPILITMIGDDHDSIRSRESRSKFKSGSLMQTNSQRIFTETMHDIVKTLFITIMTRMIAGLIMINRRWLFQLVYLFLGVIIYHIVLEFLSLYNLRPSESWENF